MGMKEKRIPTIIHYCWFGHNPLPEFSRQCLKSWRKKCPDYEIREWNEENFDLESCPLYVRQAYSAGKWAFVTDYVRLYVVYKYGGIYLDTDIELLKSFDSLLSYEAFFGFEDETYVNTGVGFGAVAGCKILAEMMRDYESIPFVRPDGSMDTMPCPRRNTEVFVKHGLIQDGSKQVLKGNILVLPKIYLCPIDYRTNKRSYSLRTISIHHYSASWHTEKQKQERERLRLETEKRRKDKMKENLIRTPKKVLKAVLGKDNFEKVKKWLS